MSDPHAPAWDQARALAESLPFGLAHLDRDLRYVFVNAALAAMNGRSPEEHLGRTVEEVLPGLADTLPAVMRRVIATGEVVPDLEVSGTVLGDTGPPGHWRVTHFPIRGPGGDIAGVGAIVVDRTAEVRAQAAQRRTERTLAEVIERAPMAIAMFDREMRYLAASRRFRADFRLGDREVIGEGNYALFPQVPERIRAFHRRALAGEAVWPGEQIFRHADGAVEHLRPVVFPWYEDEGRVGGIVIMCEMITAQRDAEARYRTLFETMGQGVVYLDASGVIIDANPAAERILGLTLDQLRGRTTMDPRWRTIREDGSEFPGEEHPVMVALRTGQEAAGVVMGVHHPKENGPRWIRIQAVPGAAPDGGRPSHVYAVFSDITEERGAEQERAARAEELRDANAELSRALQLKDEFLAMMSHELRTPLNAVLGFTDALREGVFGPLSARQDDVLGTVSASARHLLDTLTDILDLAQIGAGQVELEPRRVEVSTLVAWALHEVETAAREKSVRLHQSLELGVDRLVGDELRLRRILLALLDNAVKFTPEGGTVTLEVTGDAAREQIRFAVRDTGIGIAPEDLGRLFQPFTQLDGRLSRRFGGIGLGLTLVQRLVELHRGSITVESTPDAGSCFTVTLPWSP